ncbi:MAG: hypothetical protein KAH21_00285, partial [Spirochaetaceae bacterium]|nr:hypothetical protein [Spirochaetaceae bacterium]
LNDGPYEQIHMATIGGEYQFPGAAFRLGMEYTFSIANNDGLQEDRKGISGDVTEVNPYSTYTPYAGVTNAVSIFVRIYPEY